MLPRGRGAPEGPCLPAPRRRHRVPEADRGERPHRRRIDVPKADLGREGVPVTYVPFRNAHLVAIAVSWAEVIGAKNIYIGAVAADSSGYPDCRPNSTRR